MGSRARADRWSCDSAWRTQSSPCPARWASYEIYSAAISPDYPGGWRAFARVFSCASESDGFWPTPTPPASANSQAVCVPIPQDTASWIARSPRSRKGTGLSLLPMSPEGRDRRFRDRPPQSGPPGRCRHVLQVVRLCHPVGQRRLDLIAVHDVDEMGDLRARRRGRLADERRLDAADECRVSSFPLGTTKSNAFRANIIELGAQIRCSPGRRRSRARAPGVPDPLRSRHFLPGGGPAVMLDAGIDPLLAVVILVPEAIRSTRETSWPELKSGLPGRFRPVRTRHTGCSGGRVDSGRNRP